MMLLLGSKTESIRLPKNRSVFGLSCKLKVIVVSVMLLLSVSKDMKNKFPSRSGCIRISNFGRNGCPLRTVYTDTCKAKLALQVRPRKSWHKFSQELYWVVKVKVSQQISLKRSTCAQRGGGGALTGPSESASPTLTSKRAAKQDKRNVIAPGIFINLQCAKVGQL